ncbi:hypothetical protein C8Q78DRAFT_1083661 [Trametes maxima]|nr:hypothetical protein C8Q78DRAFT_1083661 [Trametes maxima]
MDGENIAHFIDPDILEKLDALEHEEKLQADGFYDSQSDMFYSADEREASVVKVSHKKRLVSQNTKVMKSHAVLPRTAGLRTLSELTTEMAKAGLDLSRRAEILANPNTPLSAAHGQAMYVGKDRP